MLITPLTQDGATPLCVASWKGHSDVVNILLRNGADINLAWQVMYTYYNGVFIDSLPMLPLY